MSCIAAAVCGKTRAIPDAVPLAGHEVPDVVAVLVRAAVGVLGATRGEGVRLAREVVVLVRADEDPTPDEHAPLFHAQDELTAAHCAAS